MGYVLIILVLLAAVGIVARLVLAARPPRPTTEVGGSDTTDRDVVPPAHPADPVPGSATARDDES